MLAALPCPLRQLEYGLLTREELEACVRMEFNPVRIGFYGAGSPDLWTRDVLNLGISPAALLEAVRAKHLSARLLLATVGTAVYSLVHVSLAGVIQLIHVYQGGMNAVGLQCTRAKCTT